MAFQKRETSLIKCKGLFYKKKFYVLEIMFSIHSEFPVGVWHDSSLFCSVAACMEHNSYLVWMDNIMHSLLL